MAGAWPSLCGGDGTFRASTWNSLHSGKTGRGMSALRGGANVRSWREAAVASLLQEPSSVCVDHKVNLGASLVAVADEPGGRKAGPSDDPLEHSDRLNAGLFCHNTEARFQASWQCCHRLRRIIEVRVGEDVREVERGLSHKAVGVDGEPTTFGEVEDVVVMKVAVEGADVALI